MSKTHGGKSHRHSKRGGQPQRGGDRQWDKERRGERETRLPPGGEERQTEPKLWPQGQLEPTGWAADSRWATSGSLWSPRGSPGTRGNCGPGRVGLGIWRPGQRAFHQAGRVQPSRLPSREVRESCGQSPADRGRGGCKLGWNVDDLEAGDPLRSLSTAVRATK